MADETMKKTKQKMCVSVRARERERASAYLPEIKIIFKKLNLADARNLSIPFPFTPFLFPLPQHFLIFYDALIGQSLRIYLHSDSSNFFRKKKKRKGGGKDKKI